MLKLQVFVSDDCWTCVEARRVVSDLEGRYPDLMVEVIDVDSAEPPADVFAVPTYLLNDRVIFLGNPTRQELMGKLDAALSVNPA